jgi:hypothetical protein
MLTAFVSDLRHATRTLVRAPWFTSVSVATLGAGIALSVSVVTVVNAYLIRTLPYPASDRLYNVSYAEPNRPIPPPGMEKLDWDALSDVIEYPIAWDLDFFSLRGAPYAESAQGAWVTPGFVEALGIPVSLGRGLGADDFGAGRAPSSSSVIGSGKRGSAEIPRSSAAGSMPRRAIGLTKSRRSPSSACCRRGSGTSTPSPTSSRRCGRRRFRTW